MLTEKQVEHIWRNIQEQQKEDDVFDTWLFWTPDGNRENITTPGTMLYPINTKVAYKYFQDNNLRVMVFDSKLNGIWLEDGGNVE